MKARLFRWLTTNYNPKPGSRPFLERLEQKEIAGIRVSVAVLSDRESIECLGVRLARQGMQAVWIEIDNQSDHGQRLDRYSIDASYYTPLEAASVNHFSVGRRFLSFGILGWFFLVLLPLLPAKIISARLANRRMSAVFRQLALPGGVILAGEQRCGLIYTRLDEGLKTMLFRFVSDADVATVSFALEVPGLLLRAVAQDSEHGETTEVELEDLIHWSVEQPRCTSGRSGRREGDPLNLIVVGHRDLVRQCFGSRWDDAEAVNWATSLKTARAFLLESVYRYSPVSPLFYEGRMQDLALQRARASINERVHLRLWKTTMRVQGDTVWIGQVSRDIGVRFTIKTWNLTTHRIDPDVDESRDYVVDSLAAGGHLGKIALVPGCDRTDSGSPRKNLTGDPYFTDGRRALLVLCAQGGRAESLVCSEHHGEQGI